MANTVVLGAGIIGVSTAYYLSRHQPGNTIHLVEPSPELFASASGNAGGFLARDWFGPGAASLGALSFDEHRRLAEAHDGAKRWGYSRSTALSYPYASPGAGRKGQRAGEDWLRQGTSRADSAAASGNEAKKGGGGDDDGGLDALVPPWLRRGKGASIKPIGDAGTTAQLDPKLLCRFLLDECLRRGVRLHHPARATAVMSDVRDELSSVTIADTASSTETDVPCTRLIIAAGAWSPQVFTGLFPSSRSKLPVSSLAGHSLVLRSPRWTAGALEGEGEGEDNRKGGCHAVFTTTRSGFAPEIFSRAGGEIYVAGLNSASLPLPALATEAQVSREAIDEVRRVAARLLGHPGGGGGGGGEDAVADDDDDDLEVVREGLCFRPVTPYGTPIISRINDELLGGGITTRPDAEGGVFLAAGHGPWGISHSLGTGMVLAEICQGRHLSADVRSLVIW